MSEEKPNWEEMLLEYFSDELDQANVHEIVKRAIEEEREKILKKINRIIPKEKPGLCHDGQVGMFSAQNDGIKYGEWEMGQKILKLVKV